MDSSNSDTSSFISNSPNALYLWSPKIKTGIYKIYRIQTFSLPNFLIQCITLNPTSAKGFYKYFFSKNPTLVFSHVYYNQIAGWQIWLNGVSKNVDLTKIFAKLSIINFVRIVTPTLNETNPTIFSKIHLCNAKCITLYNQIIFYNELLILCPNAENVMFKTVRVKVDDNADASLEDIVKLMPKLRVFRYFFPPKALSITDKTFKELVKLPHFSIMKIFSIRDIPETFDTESFYNYMKKNEKTQFWLKFSEDVSKDYKDRIEEIIDEIINVIESQKYDYLLPVIYFTGLSYTKYNKIRKD